MYEEDDAHKETRNVACNVTPVVTNNANQTLMTYCCSDSGISSHDDDTSRSSCDSYSRQVIRFSVC